MRRERGIALGYFEEIGSGGVENEGGDGVVAGG